jgi:predicted alpha/beta superfamily hydrolase
MLIYGCSVSATWEPYASTSESTVTGELLVHRALDRDLLCLLPPGYDTGRRYPVLYAQDGQNLFDEATAHTGEWRIDETMAELAGEGIEAIVVGIPNRGDSRASEYCPWPQEPWVSDSRADDYVDFVLGSVKPLVERSFATGESAGILGSSLGALLSLYAFFSRPGTFDFAGALSLAFFGGEEAFGFFDRAAFVGGRIWLDVGDHETAEDPAVDAWYVENFERMRALLERKGYRDDRLRATLVPGGIHLESAWGERFPDVMRFWLA